MDPLMASRGKSSVRVPACKADREQASRAVDEGRDEGAEHHLGRTVAEEVAQQPRRELGRGELERDDGQTEDQSDDGHDGAADRDQYCSGIVGGALEGQPISHRTRGKSDLGHQKAGGERDQGGHTG